MINLSLFSQTKTYTENFEGSTTDLNEAPWTIHGWGTTVEGTNMGTGTATIIDDPTEIGNRVMKVDKRVPPPGEKYDVNSSREELKYLSKAKDIPGTPEAFPPWFTPLTYRWRFYFTGDHDWDKPGNGNFVVCQWHHSSQMNVGGGPPANFRIASDDLRFKARWASPEDPTNEDVKEANYLVWEDLQKNTWYYIVVDITWDYREGKSGQIKAYMKEGGWPAKSDLVLDHSGPGKATGFNWALTNFAQVGLYAWRWRNPLGADQSREAGVEKFEFYIDDWEYTQGKHSFSDNSNQFPDANAGPSKTITLPIDKVTLNGTASDPDGLITSYQWTQKDGPKNATLTAANSASTEASALIEGSYVFRLTVTDDDGAIASDEVSVTVEPASNQEPIADAGLSKSITLPTNAITLNGSAIDPDGSIVSYQWVQVSGPASAVLEGSNTADAEAGNLVEGTYVFELTATDNDGATGSDKTFVTVMTAPNQEPNANAGPNQTITPPDDKVTLNGTASDADGSITSYQWTQQTGPNNAILTGVSSASMEAGGLIEGAYVFRLTVTDDDGALAYDEVSVTVEPAPNQQPNADAGPNQTITLPEDKVTLNGTASDPDGSITSYQWTQQQGPNNAILTGAENASMEASGLIEGSYVFRLTVTDDDGALAYDEVSVTVEPTPNQQPNADAGLNQSITLPADKVTLNGTAFDPDGSITSYQWIQQEGPNNATLTGASNADTEANGLIEGSYVFRLTVTDDDGALAYDEVSVAVQPPPNQDPNADAGSNQTITLPDDVVTLNGSASDTDGSITAYLWTQQQGPNNATLTGVSSASMEASRLIEGTYVFRLTVTDDDGAQAYDEVSVTVEPTPNQQPIADAGPNQSITLPADKVTLNGTASDPDGSITSYQWTQQDGPTNATLTAANSASTEAGGLIEGAYVFRLTVTDDDGATAYDEITVTVESTTNQQPNADAGPNQTITLPEDKVTLNGTASDTDGSITAYLWTQQTGPNNATLTAANSASMEASGLIEGSYVFRLTVTDNQGATDQDSLQVTVLAASNNRAPDANAGPNQTIILPADKVTLNGTASDTDGSITAYLWTQQEGPNNATLTGAGTTSVEASGLIEGSYVFRLTVTDDDGAQAYDEVSVTVEPTPNQQPNADAGPNQFITLPEDKVTLNGTASDTDGSITAYQWTQQTGPNNAILTGVSSASMEAGGLIEGAYVFRMTVTDDQGAQAYDEVSVTVEPAPNQQPIADAGPNQTITLPDDKVTLNGAASDPDGSITSYLWTQQQGPNNAILTGVSSASMEASRLIEGVYVFRLTVTDDDGAQAYDEVSVTVEPTPNQQPNADAGPNQFITLPEDKVTLNGTAADPDGSITAYQWTQQEGPNATLTGAENASMEAGGLIEGTYIFRLTVTDDDGAQAYDEISVTVEPAPNQQPNADAGPNQTITLPADKVTLNGTAADPDGSITAYQWTQQDGPNNATLTAANSASTEAGGLIEGAYVFRLTVTDDDGATAYDEVSVTVEPAPNQQPNADAGPNQTITLPANLVTLNGTASDTDGSITAYQWTQQEGPNKATLTGINSPSLEASGLVEGSYVFKLTVTDDQGATDTDEVEIMLIAAPITVSAIITDASCNANDGSIVLTLTGGQGPFSFDWSNGATTKDITEIPPGDYQVTITDQNGTSIKESYTVNSSQANLIITAEIDHTSCSKDDGAIRVTVSGGTAPYSFEWSTGEKASAIQRLASGTYSLVVADKNGCNKQVTFEVPIEPGETEFELNSKVTNASCSGNDGSISLEVLGDNGPYTFLWDTGATTPNLTGLGIGGYQVLITDRHGCFMKEVFIVDQNSIPDPVIIRSGDSLLVEQQATYYQWYKDGIVLEGSTQNFLKFSEPGSYTVQIADGNCTNISQPFVVEEVIESNSSSFTIQQVEIFPNPVANYLKVRTQVNGSAETSISIYDFQGTELMSQDLGVVTSEITAKLNVSSFPSGIYFIKITSGQEVLTRKFIKR